MRQPEPPTLGQPVQTNRFVMTERKAHQAWAALISRKPRAAELMHHLVASMGHQNAVVISQKLLAKIMGRSVDTVQRAIADLEAERWIQVVRVNGTGTASAYVVNDRVAWGQPRDQLRISVFSATVITDAADQTDTTMETAELRKIPSIFPGERQLPGGAPADPPAQESLPGLEPDLPHLTDKESPDPWAEERTRLAEQDATGAPRHVGGMVVTRR